jgi:hypothetical protein
MIETPRDNGSHPRDHGDNVDWAAITPYRGQTPPAHDDEWTVSSISRHFTPGTRAETVVGSPTGAAVTLGEPHWYVTVKRDQYPERKTVTAEYDHYVFPDTAALAAWFGDDVETQP